jgi:hypothetical protein
MRSNNGHKKPGQKMSSRFGMSRKEEREAVKAHLLPSSAESKAYGRDPGFSAREWGRRQRWSLRQSRVHNKSLPLFDMDGSYYHE